MKKLSFEEIYAVHKKIIYLETSRKLNRKELIEESMQETLVKIHLQYEKISKMEPAAQAVYIGKVARGTAINIFYKEIERQNKIVYIEDYKDDCPEFLKESAFIMADAVFESDMKEILDELPEPDREIIHLVYFDEMEYVEIAEILHISQEAARQRLSRAKKKLKSIIEKYQVTLEDVK